MRTSKPRHGVPGAGDPRTGLVHPRLSDTFCDGLPFHRQQWMA
ncbi:hypothetical protein [Myxococcus stipitatus]|nr:hypothetical protein [Myxococcus stipitatus]